MMEKGGSVSLFDLRSNSHLESVELATFVMWPLPWALEALGLSDVPTKLS